MSWIKFFRDPKPDPCAALPQLLRGALSPLMAHNAPGFAERLLHTSRADDLIGIDQRLRGYWSGAYSGWSPNTLGHIVSCPMPNEDRQSLLFIASSHPDGRERQKAVWRLSQFPGRLTLAAALIRSSDWVPQVRFAARDAVGQLLRACAADDVLAVLPIVLRLKHRERSLDGWLAESVEAWFLSPSNIDLLHRARAAGDPGVQVWAFLQSVQHGYVPLVQAVLHPDPRVGLYALRHAQETMGAGAVADLATSGLDAGHPAVRRECLRALASADAGAAAAALPRALLDRSAGVRRLAAYLTRKGGADARLIWRDALDHSPPSVPIGALASLAEEAEPEDATRLRDLLFVERSIVRQHALKGLLRIGQTISAEDLARLLPLGGSRVMAALVAAVRDSAILLDKDSLLRVLEGHELNELGRSGLARLLEVGGLWDCLERLLALKVQETDHQWWLAALDNWIARSAAYSPLFDMKKQTLLEMTRARAADVGPERVMKIEAALHRY